MRAVGGVAPRREAVMDAIRAAIEAGERGDFRVIQGLTVRLARAINRVPGRTGKVFADRYHARVLKTPREVRKRAAPVAPARSWLLTEGWRKHGLLAFDEVPG